jgi:CheY-like chemotaxis protein
MAAAKPSNPPRNRIVLLAEDEAMIRELVSTFLTNLGYVVHEAENGKKALEEAKKLGPKNIALLVTDLVMPVMGGLELAGELRKLEGNTKVLFISGFTDDLVILEAQAKAQTAFLRKPFSFETLRQRIDGLLAEE